MKKLTLIILLAITMGTISATTKDSTIVSIKITNSGKNITVNSSRNLSNRSYFNFFKRFVEYGANVEKIDSIKPYPYAETVTIKITVTGYRFQIDSSEKISKEHLFYLFRILQNRYSILPNESPKVRGV